MKILFNQLYQELEQQLVRLNSESDVLLYVSEQALILISACLEKIREELKHYSFENEAEEIDFFRNKKPLLTSRLIFFNTRFIIESGKPVGNKKILKAYYREQSQKLERYFKENIEFYRYYRSGSSELDALYFIRGVRLAIPLQESFYLEQDQAYCTSHDYKVACILANDMLQEFLENSIAQLGADAPAEVASVKWTGPKIGLIELIYALHSEGVFNNGEAMLKDISNIIEGAFQVELGHIPRHFIEIRDRKTAPTRFLDSLTEKLLHRMAEADR